MVELGLTNSAAVSRDVASISEIAGNFLSFAGTNSVGHRARMVVLLIFHRLSRRH